MDRALGASAIPTHLFSFLEKIRLFMKMGLGLIICTYSTFACDSVSCHKALLGGDGLAELLYVCGLFGDLDDRIWPHP